MRGTGSSRQRAADDPSVVSTSGTWERVGFDNGENNNTIPYRDEGVRKMQGGSQSIVVVIRRSSLGRLDRPLPVMNVLQNVG